MTDRELMQQALEDICGARLCEVNSMSSRHEMLRLMDKAIKALRERLAQPEQEPVAWMCSDFVLMHRGYSRFSPIRQGDWNIPVYTTPPRREWVELTLEEIGLLTTGDGWSHLETPALALFARAIEAKLREKNA